ncbi:hypothetical protein G0Q06_10590 [Puniceicoccales bacterium CK1056]|uniref:Solute-binding protein family 5 domain-containing protein n=1 Tax=Oceanipulchritudo coccoides TaxID=2706888 RepID=A0A6B2M3V7_9BACT|nr:ABC transporter substrate-binding protein [Oceanipulchritudo coccoides]NDV62899.1 hypothetical protein [Oceanipulchritudo coccoides]
MSVIVLAGCGRREGDEVAAYDNTEEVEAYYEAHPERFVFASPEDLPEGLDWQDGSELASFGDPRAKRGGHLRLRLPRLQATLRVLGPDANGSLRGPLWNANSVFLVSGHPWEDGYIPGLARRWAVENTTPQRIYFELDPDARWSDGRPVTTEDFLFSLYVLLSPHVQDPAVNRVYDENIANITRYDERTFSLTLAKPTPSPLAWGASYILFQREFYREFGPDYTDRYHSRFAPVTGAYTLDTEDIRRGEQVTFRRLTNWWADDKPFYRYRYNVDKLTYVVVRDDFKAFEAFLNGTLDLFPINETELWYDRADVDPIKNGYIERAQVYHLLPTGSMGLFINSMSPLLDNRDIRVGIQHATNYERVNKDIHRGDQRRIRSFVDGYGPYDHTDMRARDFSIDKALEEFAKAGFTERGPDGILVNDAGQRLSFTFSISSRSEESRIALVLREEAAQAGLDLRIEEMDPTAFFTKVFEKNHEICLFGWNTGYAKVPTFEWEMRGEDAGKPKNFNSTNIRDDRLDALLEEWDQLRDPEKAYQVSHDIQERLYEYAAWVPGLSADFTRWGCWRWMQWPEYFQVPKYFMFTASGVFWIDEDIREQTLEARRKGQGFPPKTTVYDRWKQ